MLTWSVSLPTLCAIVYLAGHASFLLAAKRPPVDRRRLLTIDMALMAGLVALVALGADAGGGWRLALRLWAPLVFFWWAYLWAGRVLHVFHDPQTSWDGPIIAWEDRLLGQPSLTWAGVPKPLLTEVLHAFYCGYYLYAPVLGIALRLQGRAQDFEAMSLAVVLAYTVGYSCFALLPVWGPRWGLVESGDLLRDQQILRGYGLTRLLNRVMYGGPAHKGGAMPSTHSSTAIVFLIWSGRIWGIEGAVAAGVAVAGMWIGSVYGRYHYVLDVVAGALLGLASVAVADALYRL